MKKQIAKILKLEIESERFHRFYNKEMEDYITTNFERGTRAEIHNTKIVEEYFEEWADRIMNIIKDRMPLEEYNNLCDVAKLEKGFGQKKIKYASDEQVKAASEKVNKQFGEVFKKLGNE